MVHGLRGLEHVAGSAALGRVLEERVDGVAVHVHLQVWGKKKLALEKVGGTTWPMGTKDLS